MATSRYYFSALDETEMANTEDCSAFEIFRPIADAVNHIAHRHNKIIFNQAVTDDMYASPAGSFSPLYRIRYNDNFSQFRKYSHRVIARMLGTGSATLAPAVQGFPSASATKMFFPATFLSSTPNQAKHVEYQEVHGDNTVSNAYQDLSVSSEDDVRPLSLAIVGKRWASADATVDTASAGAVEPNLWSMGKRIVHTDLRSLRDAIHENWTDNRRTFGAMSSIGFGTAAQNIMTTSTTGTPGVNLLDTPSAITSQTANTPGFFCPVRYTGRLADATIKANVAVYAQVVSAGSGGTGRVRFQSLNTGNTVDITDIDTTAKWWPSTSGTTISIGDIGTDEYDKLDVFGRMTAASGADVLRVWAISIVEDPD